MDLPVLTTVERFKDCKIWMAVSINFKSVPKCVSKSFCLQNTSASIPGAPMRATANGNFSSRSLILE